MIKKLIYCFIFILLLFSKVAVSQYTMYKALYIYNFTKRIDWPTNRNNKTFDVVVFGKDCEITEHLINFTQGKKVINQRINVTETIDLSEIYTAEIIYVPKDFNKLLYRTNNNELKKRNPLIITDKKGYLADVTFVETDKALLFEIKPKKIKKKGLKISNTLLNLGIIKGDE